jgi:hypothetical protein
LTFGCWTFCTKLAVLTEVWRRSYSSREVENPRAGITLRWCGIGPEIGSQWCCDNTVSAEPYQCWRGQSCGLATCSSIVDWLHAVRLWTRYMQFDCGLAVCSSIEGSGGLSSLDASRAASSTLGTVDVSVCLDALSGDLCLIVVCVTRASELPGFSFRLSLPHL